MERKQARNQQIIKLYSGHDGLGEKSGETKRWDPLSKILLMLCLGMCTVKRCGWGKPPVGQGDTTGEPDLGQPSTIHFFRLQGLDT